MFATRRIKEKTAAKLVNAYEGKRPPSLDLFLDFIGITEDEFNEIALQHRVSPYSHDFDKTVRGEKLPDHDKWERKGKMKREDAEVQLKRWRIRSNN